MTVDMLSPRFNLESPQLGLESDIINIYFRFRLGFMFSLLEVFADRKRAQIVLIGYVPQWLLAIHYSSPVDCIAFAHPNGLRPSVYIIML